jgi:hypothetical protein
MLYFDWPFHIHQPLRKKSLPLPKTSTGHKLKLGFHCYYNGTHKKLFGNSAATVLDLIRFTSMPNNQSPSNSGRIQNPHRSMEELRVAQAELASSKRKVFVRLSEGAVAFLTERKQAKAEISTMIRDEIKREGDEEERRTT